MPVYEYRCHQCNKVFEYQQRMADPAKTTCEECSGQLERLISRSSFSFKGGGWYKDLYASPKADAPATTASGDPVKTESTAKTTETAKTETAKTEKTESSGGSGTGTGTGTGSGGGAGSAGGSSTAAAAPAK